MLNRLCFKDMFICVSGRFFPVENCAFINRLLNLILLFQEWSFLGVTSDAYHTRVQDSQ